MRERLYKEGAPTIFLHGGCDIHDAINITAIQSNYNIDRDSFRLNNTLSNFDITRRFRENTSLASMYSSPGSVAFRLYETLLKCPRHTFTYNHMVAAEELLTVSYTHLRAHET